MWTVRNRVVLGLLAVLEISGRTVNLLSPSLRESHKVNSIGILIEELISGPLINCNIFLLMDKHSRDWIPAQWSDAATALIATQEDMALGRYPTHYLRGSNYVAILIFSKPPTTLLQNLALSDIWNPSFLLLINTNSSQFSSSVLNDGVVQRSRHVVLLQAFLKGATTSYTVFTTLPFRAGSSRTLIGIWDEIKNKLTTGLFVDRHPSMEGAVFRLGSWCDDYPFIYLRHNQCVGTNLDTLDLLAAKLNFSYKVQMETQDQKWGSLEDGRWTGMLGDLVYNEKHLVINLFLVNYERWRNFDITYPYYAEGFGFLAPLPSPVSQLQSLVYPFAGTMWLALIVCTLFTSLLSTVLSAFVLKQSDYSKHCMMVCSGVLRQAVLLKGRRWLAAWWLSCIIVTTAYTSNLIAFLTAPMYPTRIETVSELVQSPFRLLMQDYGNFVPDALKMSSDQSLAALGKKLDLLPVEVGYATCVSAVLNHTHVLSETYSYLRNLQIQHSAIRHSYLMKEQIYSGHMSWILPRNTPYTHKISRLLIILRETGFLNKLYADHFATSEHVNEVSPERPSRLSVEQLQGAFLLLLLTLAVSIISFLAELMVRKIVK